MQLTYRALLTPLLQPGGLEPEIALCDVAREPREVRCALDPAADPPEHVRPFYAVDDLSMLAREPPVVGMTECRP